MGINSYVAHICRNKKCNAIWLDRDLTCVKSKPPSRKYCQECCKNLGINYETQTPTSNLTFKELVHKKDLQERAKKMRDKRDSKH